MTVISRIISSVWRAVRSHSPPDPNQSKSNKSKKDPAEGVIFFKPGGLLSDLS